MLGSGGSGRAGKEGGCGGGELEGAEVARRLTPDAETAKIPCMERSASPGLVAVALAGLAVQVQVMAQTPAHQKIDVSRLGPQIGERVPDFNLKYQNGQTRTLQSIIGPKGAVLLFYRSADWGPYCT